MRIGTDHWLTTGADESGVPDRFRIIREPIPGGSLMEPPARPRRLLVMHFTNGGPALSTINNWWRSPAANGACAHVIIDRDGTIFQCRAFNRTAGHAGISGWRDPNTGHVYRNLNFCSLGIELANEGDERIQSAARIPGYRTIQARHRNGGPVRTWEVFPDAQVIAANMVAVLLVRRYRLDDIVGHEDVSPSRKIDPGPAFPMKDFRESLGFAGLPAVFRA